MACKDEMRMFSCFTLDVMGLNETGIYENLQFLLDNCRASGAIFFSFAPFWPHEGPLVQSCFTGQLPGTDCFYTGQSPDVLEVGKV